MTKNLNLSNNVGSDQFESISESNVSHISKVSRASKKGKKKIKKVKKTDKLRDVVIEFMKSDAGEYM